MRQTLVLTLAAAGLMGAQQEPSITNADVRRASAASGLESALRSLVASSRPAWVGYPVRAIAGEHNSCCWDQYGRGCGLEGSGRVAANQTSNAPVMLEGHSHVLVLLRYAQGALDKVRVLAPDCPLDAGGLDFHWLTDVRTSDSVRMLTDVATLDRAPKRAVEGAIHGIAMHAGQEADAALTRLTAPSHAEPVRKKALFWLANLRGRHGYATVAKVLREDTSESVREHCVFALTLSREPEALQELVRTAKQDEMPRIRSKALFWLSQKASKQISDTISESAERDPETEVQKQAVFALSRLPREEGIPRLIRIAQTHGNPAVRKQAMFWLGQSRDPRAVDFFEKALLK